MIWDCFLYNGETEVFEIAYHELSGLDVFHVVVDSSYTFTGLKKGTTAFPLLDRDDYEIITVDDMPNTGNPWDNERFQRNAIMRGLTGADDNDLVIIRDADEIPSASAIKRYNPSMGIACFIMDKMGYWLNCVEGFQSWEIAKIMTYGRLKQTSPDQVRNAGPDNKIENGGWHYSYLGDKSRIVTKLESFSHTECNRQELKDQLEYKIKTGQSLWGDDYWTIIPIDERSPLEVRQNVQKYQHLIHD